MSSPDLPTILLIQDAWHTPTHYSRLIDQLSLYGFQVACPQLLSCNTETNNTSGFHEDTTLIYQLCFDLACEGRDILVFMHGYGGFVGTEILGELGKTQRAGFGQTGGIINLIYFASWLPNTDEVLGDMYGGEWPTWIEEQPDESLVLIAPQESIYNDLGPMEQTHYTHHLTRFSAKAPDIHISTPDPAWSLIPSTVIVCEDDILIDFDTQRDQFEAAKKSGATVSDIMMDDSAHDAFINAPEKVVALILTVINQGDEPAHVPSKEGMEKLMRVMTMGSESDVDSTKGESGGNSSEAESGKFFDAQALMRRHSAFH